MPLQTRTAKTLFDIFKQLDVSQIDVEQFHQQRLEATQQENQSKGNADIGTAQHSINNSGDNVHISQTNFGLFQPNINISGNDVGTIVTGNQTVNIDNKK